jgi:hypothetical protein
VSRHFTEADASVNLGLPLATDITEGRIADVADFREIAIRTTSSDSFLIDITLEPAEGGPM